MFLKIMLISSSVCQFHERLSFSIALNMVPIKYLTVQSDDLLVISIDNIK